MIPTLQDQKEEDKNNISLGTERSHQNLFIEKPKDLVLADGETEGRKWEEERSRSSEASVWIYDDWVPWISLSCVEWFLV